jgi:hypothetical protein
MDQALRHQGKSDPRMVHPQQCRKTKKKPLSLMNRPGKRSLSIYEALQASCIAEPHRTSAMLPTTSILASPGY